MLKEKDENPERLHYVARSYLFQQFTEQQWLLLHLSKYDIELDIQVKGNLRGLFLYNFILLLPSLKFLLIETLHITLIAANLIISYQLRI